MKDPDAEGWRVVVRTDRATGPVMRGNERQCRAVACSIVGMTVADDAGVSLGRVVEAAAEPSPAGMADAGPRAGAGEGRDA